MSMKHLLKSLSPIPSNGVSPAMASCRSLFGPLRRIVSGLLMVIAALVTLAPPAHAAVLTLGVSVTNVSCNGGSNGVASVTPSGGTPPYTYSWSHSASNLSVVTGLSAATYRVTVIDAVSALATSLITISQPTVLSASTSVTHVAINGGSTGAATVFANGGTPSYRYSWSPYGGSSSTATGLSAGTYTVTVTDANDCTLSRSVTIVQPPVLSASISATQASAAGASDASATVTASGGWTPYTYSWSPSGGTAATATGLVAGAYSVTVTDGGGAQVTQSVTITAAKANQAVLAMNASTITPAYGSTVTLGTTGGSGSGALTYASNSANCTVSGATLTAASVGSCTITATKAEDANYLAATATLGITVGQASQAITFGAAPTIIVGATGTVHATGGLSGNAIVYASATPAACTVNSGTGVVTGVAAGSNNCTISADQAGNANYSAAPRASQTFSIGAPPVVAPTITSLLVTYVGIAAPAQVANLTTDEGLAFMADMAALLANALGQPLQVLGQNALGTVTLDGFNGGRLAFVPGNYQGGGDSRANGIYPLGDGRYQVVRNGQSLTIAPALVRMDQLLALLPGVSARQADNGVLIATINGVTHVVQPGVQVQRDVATGNARLVMGSDGYWHFIDALGNNQVLYPAFADAEALRNALWTLDTGATSAIQLDGTASILFQGRGYTLVPDLILSSVPTERLGQSVWFEGAARYRMVGNQPAGMAQGVTVKP